MTQRWNLRKHDAKSAKKLADALEVPRLVAALLVSRGYVDEGAARAFIHPSLAKLPDPSLLPTMDAAAERLVRAARAGETVWVYTDYDADGVTSAALLAEFFTRSRIKCKTYLPRRDREGYGLSLEAIDEISAADGTLIVTADCGVTAVEQVEYAMELGIEVVVTDHHAPGPELPRAVAVVNPNLDGSAYGREPLAGVGVAWNLVSATRRKLRKEGWYEEGHEVDVRELLDLVALGTVADVVPLRGVNRVLTTVGLARMNRFPREGVKALCELAGVRRPIKAHHIGFQIAPRINAAGRLAGPQEALELLSSADENKASEIAQTLDALNVERRRVERSILDEAVATLEERGDIPGRWSLVVESERFHSGVVGIVAGRLAERFNRPTIVLATKDGVTNGSARSIPGFNLLDALHGCKELFDRYGGHAAAAGMTMKSDRIDELMERFEDSVRERMDEQMLIPLVEIDLEVEPGEMTINNIEKLGLLEPYGMGNRSPTLLCRNLEVASAGTFGKQKDHGRARVYRDGVNLAVKGWGMAEEVGGLTTGEWIDLVFRPRINEFEGERKVELTVMGIRPAGW